MAQYLVSISSVQTYFIFAAASLTPCTVITAVLSLGVSGQFYWTILRMDPTEKPLSESLNHKRSEPKAGLTAFLCFLITSAGLLEPIHSYMHFINFWETCMCQVLQQVMDNGPVPHGVSSLEEEGIKEIR